MSFLRVFGHLGWFWFPCPRKGSYVRPSLFHGRPRSDVGEKNTISPHWLLVKDWIWIIFQELKVEKSINDTFMTILNVDEWDHWDPNDPQWHDQKLKPEIQHRPFINWARYLSSIPRCYAASPWTTVQPVARQIGHGTANRAGPLRQRKGQDHVLNFVKIIMKYHGCSKDDSSLMLIIWSEVFFVRWKALFCSIGHGLVRRFR